MSKSTKSSSRRKIAAGALAVVAGLGLSFASASQLNLAAPSTVQAGAVDVASDCQPSSAVIGVAFATPTLTGGNYVSSQVALSNIAAGCNGRTYKVRFLGTGNTPLGTEATGSITGTTLNVPLTGVSQNDVVRIAMTIY